MIEVRALEKRFVGGPAVLRGVSLAVAKGAVAVVIGPSGSGKSTLLRCINGLEPFDAGEVRVGELVLPPGVDPKKDARLLQAVRRRVGMVFQALHLFPHMSVLENLVAGPRHVLGEAREAAEARALELLLRMNLRDKARAMPRDLSGGQQQRVAIARTLLMRPDAILVDEPTSALDPATANEVLAVMVELARDGQTMIAVTHSFRFARRAATQVHVLADGVEVESGPPERVLEAPEHEVTRALLEAERA
ncbi:MAG: amino acid ABC transporter ATP-binding protein [Myxococcales bacterium]|nr:amino acid ABC transporter ATP-binding protein [Myxococcales bacterium]